MFTPKYIDRGNVVPWVRRACSAITPKVGLALYETGGKLAIAAGTTKPTYICMEEHSEAVAAGTEILCLRVDSDIVFETTNSASFSGMNRGSKVTVTAGGLQVTATTASGVAEVVDYDDTAAAGTGGRVLVRF